MTTDNGLPDNKGNAQAGIDSEAALSPVSQDRLLDESFLGGIETGVATALGELVEAGHVEAGQIVVIGTSTSEVLGRKIGTGGAIEVAKRIYRGVMQVRERVGFFPAFQCCEHLNRALVVERALLSRYPLLEPVSVVPVPKAGGSMAAYAFRQFETPAVVEEIAAHAGIDIGGTLIGMHLRRVAVPHRASVRTIGDTSIQLAYTRPKLIGGARAVYTAEAVEGTVGSCE